MKYEINARRIETTDQSCMIENSKLFQSSKCISQIFREIEIKRKLLSLFKYVFLSRISMEKYLYF